MKHSAKTKFCQKSNILKKYISNSITGKLTNWKILDMGDSTARDMLKKLGSTR